MSAKEFNLIREPWIIVLNQEGITEEVGLLELFQRAHHFRSLVGELPTQDIAVSRLLLAILHSIFGRYDPSGEFSPIYDNSRQISADVILNRWHTIWKQGQFSNLIICEYLENFEDRFWLFHPERPFYQVAGLSIATEYSAAKLNGEIAQSGNKIRLFSSRTGISKNWLTYAEAARWLLHVNGYDDTSAKPKGKNLPSPGVGWLGKLGLVSPVGHNLFETLMLNLVMFKDESQKSWSSGEAVWEKDYVKTEERTMILMPDNPAELLTLQSRRLRLEREGDKVVRYSLLGGDFFYPENAFAEQMTFWRLNQEKKNALIEFKPRRHDPTRQIWRDLSSLLVNVRNQYRSPGVVSWVRYLKHRKLIEQLFITFQVTGVKYGDKDFFVNDVYHDSINFHFDLLDKYGQHWIPRILDNVEICDLLAKELGYLAQKLAKAMGDSNSERIKEQGAKAREQAYYLLDMPFRQWLEQIDPIHDDMLRVSTEWWEQAQLIIRKLGRDLVKQCGKQVFAERIVIENKKENRYSAPRAYNYFIYKLSTMETLKGGKG